MTLGDVYFAQAESGPIKIGFSTNVTQRLHMLSRGMRERVALLATCPGDRRAESYWLTLFQQHRIIGEWFRPHAAIFDAIASVRAHGVEAMPAAFRPEREYDSRAGAHPIAVELFDYLSVIAEARPIREGVQETLKRIALATGVPFRTIRSIWYRETRPGVSATAYVAIREYFEAHEAARYARSEPQAMLRASIRMARSGAVAASEAPHGQGGADRAVDFNTGDPLT